MENLIQVWDLRKAEVVLQLTGHSDSITGLRLSPDGTHLLSNAMVPPFQGTWSTLVLPKPDSTVHRSQAMLADLPQLYLYAAC